VRYLKTFFACALSSVGVVILGLITFLPRGEGAFGIAKVVPEIFLGGSLWIFSMVWFPVCLFLFLKERRSEKLAAPADVFLSGFAMLLGLLVLALFLGSYFSEKARLHREQNREVIASQPKIELSGVKALIDEYVQESQSGSNLQPPSGIYVAMRSLINNPATPSDVLGYLADNLNDSSVLLGFVAERTNCPSRLIPRLRTLPQVQPYLVNSPQAPADFLQQMANSESWTVRTSVAMNPNTPIEALELLAKDSRPKIRELAQKSIQQRTSGNQTGK
jgi:hypothetical protein